MIKSIKKLFIKCAFHMLQDVHKHMDNYVHKKTMKIMRRKHITTIFVLRYLNVEKVREVEEISMVKNAKTFS